MTSIELINIVLRTYIKILTSQTEIFCGLFQLKFNLTENSDYDLFEESTAEQVQYMYAESRKSWFHFWPVQTTEVSLDLFNNTCIGVATKEPYQVHLESKGNSPYQCYSCGVVFPSAGTEGHISSQLNG